MSELFHSHHFPCCLLLLALGMVTKDVELVNTSARKISSRFDKIERVELSREDLNAEEQDGKALSSQVELTSVIKTEELTE